MDLDEAITIAPFELDGQKWYIMVGWLPNSFKLNLYSPDNLWKGKFSYNRLVTFSKNLHISETDYFSSVKKCLSEQRPDYHYELSGGFFYWKQKVPRRLKQNKREDVVIEGFMPVELDTTPKHTRPDLVEVLLAINKQLKFKVNGLRTQYDTVKKDYEKCLQDTEEFFNLKIEMEKTLCDNFLNAIHVKKSEFCPLDFPNVCDNTKMVLNRLGKITACRKSKK